MAVSRHIIIHKGRSTLIKKKKKKKTQDTVVSIDIYRMG